jgi:F0F1-type ATP synthase membrane subunit b/b'
MDLLHLVDRVEELIAGAQKMPIGNRAIVDRRRMLDLIDQMRVAIPDEVREAQEIVAHRDTIIREAEEEGRIIVARAEQRAARLVEQHEITAAAQRRAEEIAREAEQRLEQRVDEVNRDIQDRVHESREIARQQMAAADDYARELLQRLEHQLQAFVRSVQSGIHQLEPAPEPPYEDIPRATARATAAVSAGAAYDDGDDGVSYAHAAYDLEGRGTYAAYEAGEEPYAATDIAEPEEVDQPRASLWSTITGVSGEAGEEDEGELENLLRRPSTGSAPLDASDLPPSEPGVIDDFEHEPLDDDPILRSRHDDE